MKLKHFIYLIVIALLLIILYVACYKEAANNTPTLPETPVQEIKLNGPITAAESEISGMTWHEERLILLPQYPARLSSEKGKGDLYTLSKTALQAYTKQGGAALTPEVLPINNIPYQIAGYEGFEAISFREDTAYLLIEAEGSEYMGYLISGVLDTNGLQLTLDSSSLRMIKTPINNHNSSFETILLTDDRIICIYERNDKKLNPSPIARTFDYALNPTADISFPNIEYRITDATALGPDGHFYAINYRYARSSLLVDPTETDDYVLTYGEGEGHKNTRIVERIVQLQYQDNQIIKLDTVPTYLRLLPDYTGRNWEGLAHLDDHTLLVVTDKHPGTILGYINL